MFLVCWSWFVSTFYLFVMWINLMCCNVQVAYFIFIRLIDVILLFAYLYTCIYFTQTQENLQVFYCCNSEFRAESTRQATSAFCMKLRVATIKYLEILLCLCKLLCPPTLSTLCWNKKNFYVAYIFIYFYCPYLQTIYTMCFWCTCSIATLKVWNLTCTHIMWQ